VTWGWRDASELPACDRIKNMFRNNVIPKQCDPDMSTGMPVAPAGTTPCRCRSCQTAVPVSTNDAAVLMTASPPNDRKCENRVGKVDRSIQYASRQSPIDQSLPELIARGRGARSRGWGFWFAILGVVALVVFGTAAWVLSAPRPMFPAPVRGLDEGGDAARGKQIFDAADCASCHASPGQPDDRRLGGGMALASPFGTLYPPNISPDPVDGIGRWSVRDLANALLSGVSPSGAHYYPAFPYTSFTHMQIEDVRDLLLYLRTLPPVSGRTPPHDLPFPFSIRRAVGLWKRIYFTPGAIQPDPLRGAEWNRGRYLTEALEHCAECHSPRDMLGGIKPASRFAGGQDPEGVGYDPNITPLGIGHWSRSDLVRLLTDGMTPDLRTVGGSMKSVVENTARLPEADRAAIADYILSLPPRGSPDAVRQR
jgi:mono/diheme cytochrome c family protein